MCARDTTKLDISREHLPACHGLGPGHPHSKGCERESGGLLALAGVLEAVDGGVLSTSSLWAPAESRALW